MSRLSMRKIKEIFRQHHNNRSYRDIAASLNIGISTISDYLSRAKKLGLVWPFPEELSEEELYQRLFNPLDKKSAQRPLPEWEDIGSYRISSPFRQWVNLYHILVVGLTELS